MSNKGVTKKTELKDEVKTRTRSKSKNVNESNPETSKKFETNLPRKSQNMEHKGDGDRSLKLQSSLKSRTQSTRSTSKQSVGSHLKPVKQSLTSTSSTSKSGPIKASSSHLTEKVQKNASLKTRSENIKSSDDSTVKKRKSREQAGGHSQEKRGVSTIYMPKSTKSKVNIKSNEKSVHQTRDREKLQDAAVSDQTKRRMSSNERRKSRTLSPSEIRMLHSAVKRPDTTENKNITKHKDNHLNAEIDLDEADYDYEDDFEDYESDFQECTDSETSPISEKSDSSRSSPHLEPIELRSREKRSVVNSTEHTKVEEERMLDSGHYDLAEARKRAARIESMFVNQSNTPPLPELREPVGKTFSDDRPVENKSLPSSADEGFEDSRSGDFTKSPPLSQIPFIEFRKSKEKQREKNLRKKPRSRGEELLEMIKLDVMEWSLLECSPIPYDEFIRNYGKLNTQQIFTQTGDDNMDIEIQTDEVFCKNKWTQFPITCRKTLRDNHDITLFKLEQVGVGNDIDNSDDVNVPLRPSYDILRLNDFLNRAGTVVLSLLEEKEHGGTVFQNDADELPFSDGFVKLSINSVTFLATRPVRIIHYSQELNKVLLTIHSPIEEEIETVSKQDYITDCCIGCVWNISEPSMPKKLFYSQCPITACCFHLTNYNVVFAGLEDGSLSLWDLKEDEMWHQKVTDKANELDWVIRTPTYTTTANAESDAHTSQIIAIRVLSKIETDSTKRSNKFVPIQICSLDENGYLIVWSIIHNMGINIDDLGLSYWGDIKLIKNQKISLLKKDTEIMNMFLDMHVDNVDTNNIYVVTNSTDVMHATCIGNRINPLTYKPAEISECGNSTCIDVCPFGQSFFLVGCNDGTIRFHYLNMERPIVQLKNEQYTDKIKVLQWSKTKPLTMYVLDDKSRMHIWDLSKSDVSPIHTLSMQKFGKISSMQLSPCSSDQDMMNQYLAFGMESGNVEIHKLKKGFYYSKKDECLQEMNIFSRYVSVS